MIFVSSKSAEWQAAESFFLNELKYGETAELSDDSFNCDKNVAIELDSDAKPESED